MGALFSFLGGGVFRMIWGEVSHTVTKLIDHKQEMERMRFQAEQDDKQHAREMESIKLQHDMGVETIRVQGEADVTKIDAETFQKGVEQVGQSTGFKWIDAWNASIKAALATEMMILITLYYKNHGWTLDGQGWELAGAVLGLYLADRLLFRRGK